MILESVVYSAMNDIQRKLELIDKQLAGRNLHKRIISTCPLSFIAVGLIAGILIQHTLLGSRTTGDELRLTSIWFTLLVLLSLATVLFFIIRWSFSTNYQYVTTYLAVGCFVCLGAIRLNSFYQSEPDDIRNFVTDTPQLATIRGLIVTEPYISKYPDWPFARFKPTDPTSSFYLKINEVQTVTGWTKATGTVHVLVDEPVLDLKIGDNVQAYCWLDKFKPPTNPGQFDVAGYLARRNVFIAASVKSRDGIKVLQKTPVGVFMRLNIQIRQAATQALLGDLPQEDTSRGLLQALLLGYRRDIGSDTYRAFRKTGLLHFISLSGMHLGIFVGIIWWLCKTAGLMKPVRAAVCIVAIGVFLLIVPPRAPTLRAAIICCVFCASFFFRRHSNPINTLSLAAIILLLIRPTQLFEAGWQLSFATVLGILLFTEKIENFLHEKTLNLFQTNHTRTTTFASRLAKKTSGTVITLFSVGFAAWLGGAGILLYHFYTITPFASIWTVLVFPLVSAILALGFLKIILFFLLPTLSAVLGFFVTILSNVLVWVVKLIAYLDISQILIGRVQLVSVIFYYCIIIFAGFVYFRHPMVKKIICIVMLLVMVTYLGITKWQRTRRDNLTITCLDVGQGQAILAQLPGQANILFDAGSLLRNDIGRRTITPFLDYAGINKIDAIIISHDDIDHINGIPEVAEHCKIGAIFADDAFFSKKDQWGTAKFLDEYLTEKGLKIKRLDKDLNLSSSVKIKVLWPSWQISYDNQLSDNDKSLVSLIKFAGTKILLCSDIENFAQRELLQLHPDLKADIVVVPHHGSVNTLESDFLEKLDAKILICSCSQRQFESLNRATDALPRALSNAKWFYTPKDGAISIRVNKNSTIQTRTFVK